MTFESIDEVRTVLRETCHIANALEELRNNLHKKKVKSINPNRLKIFFNNTFIPLRERVNLIENIVQAQKSNDRDSYVLGLIELNKIHLEELERALS